jgi:hypothetical protein
MKYIPHPPIFVSQIRTTDVWFLLALGVTWELAVRLVLLTVKRKPAALSKKEQQLALLQLETNRKRKLGPSAFVETSKLERQVLVMEKEMEDIRERRKKQLGKLEKTLHRYGNISLAIVIFILYYGVPILTVEDMEVGLVTEASKSYLKAILFPVTSVGMGMRVSRWGLPKDISASSLGALVVVWSAQVTVGKLMDAVDAYLM